jgi:hypothetical protein
MRSGGQKPKRRLFQRLLWHKSANKGGESFEACSLNMTQKTVPAQKTPFGHQTAVTGVVGNLQDCNTREL